MAAPSDFVLDFQRYPMPVGAMTVSAGALFFRASSRSVSGIPSVGALYVGSQSTANFYKGNDASRKLEAYRTRRPVRLLDVRLFQMLIPEIVRLRQIPSSPLEMKWLCDLMICYGGCSFATQLKLLMGVLRGAGLRPENVDPCRNMLAYLNRVGAMSAEAAAPEVNPIELQGVRVGITDIDYEVIARVRGIFSNIDGFIAPRMFSPAHYQHADNQILEEAVFFYPEVSLELVPYESLVGRQIGETRIENFFPRSAEPLFTDPSRAYIGGRQVASAVVRATGRSAARLAGQTLPKRVIIGQISENDNAPDITAARDRDPVGTTVCIGAHDIAEAAQTDEARAAAKAAASERDAFEKKFKRSKRLQAAYAKGYEEGWEFHRRIREDPSVSYLLRQFMVPTGIVPCGVPSGPSVI